MSVAPVLDDRSHPFAPVMYPSQLYAMKSSASKRSGSAAIQEAAVCLPIIGGVRIREKEARYAIQLKCPLTDREWRHIQLDQEAPSNVNYWASQIVWDKKCCKRRCIGRPTLYVGYWCRGRLWQSVSHWFSVIVGRVLYLNSEGWSDESQSSRWFLLTMIWHDWLDKGEWWIHLPFTTHFLP